MKFIKAWSARRHCPHMRLAGIYGDAINRTPAGRRLRCLDCGNLLDGPVVLSVVRGGECELLA